MENKQVEQTQPTYRKQSLENMCTDWLEIMFLQLDGDTELAQAVDVSDGTSKDNLHLDNQS